MFTDMLKTTVAEKAAGFLLELWTKAEEVKTKPKCGVRNLRVGAIKKTEHLKAEVWQSEDCWEKLPAFSVV